MNEIKVTDKPLTYEEIIEGERREPIFTWTRGGMIYPRKREKLFADEYILSRSQSEAIRRVKEKWGIEIYPMEASRILREEHVGIYIMDQLKRQAYWGSMTVEDWNMLMCMHVSGERKMDTKDLYCMSLIAKHRGFGESSIMNLNQTITITQADGRE